MRLALVLEQALAPVPGGTGRYAVEIAAALARSAPAGSTVTGWTGWHAALAAARVTGVAGPVRLPLPRRGLIAAWQAGLGPAPRSADLVHATTPLLPPRRGVPLVVTVHDAVPWTHPETLTARGVAWHRAMIGRAATYADRIVVPSHAAAAQLAAVIRPRHPFEVVGLGASDRLRSTGADDDERRAVALGLPHRYVVSLATLEPRKGLDVLIAAMAGTQAPDVPLLVAGQPGWGGVDVADAARRRGLPPARFRVLGRIGDAELGVVLRRATVLAAPSLAEGFGLPVLEAMSAGTAVVCSDDPALVELGGDATLVVPRQDAGALSAALARVVGDAELRAGMVARGRVRAAQFSWDAAARRLWQIYAEVAGR